MTASDLVGLESVALTIAGHTARLDLPVGWLLDPGPPVVAIPPSWDGDLPGVVVSIEHDAVRGEALAAAVTAAALSRLGDPVIVSMTLHGSHAGSDDCADDDHNGADVEIVVAHQHRGVDVTTVERHHCRPGPVRWVVGFTLAHPDVPRLLPLARRVVASLRTTS